MLLKAPGGAPPNQEIGTAVEELADFLAGAGHTLMRASFPTPPRWVTPAGLVWLTAIAEEIDFHTQRLGRAPAPDELEALTRAALALGKRSTAVDYLRARRALPARRSRWRRASGTVISDAPEHGGLPAAAGDIDGRTRPSISTAGTPSRTASRPIPRYSTSREAGGFAAARRVPKRLADRSTIRRPTRGGRETHLARRVARARAPLGG